MTTKEQVVKNLLEDSFNSKLVEALSAVNSVSPYSNAVEIAQSAINDSPGSTDTEAITALSVDYLFNQFGYVRQQ